MNNSRFSTLVYRIIGKPERWHDDYIDIMNQILDETDSFEDPENFSELEVGEKIISRLRSSNETLSAFSSLLDKSRFRMIILDQNLESIYHNHLAESLFEELREDDSSMLNPKLTTAIKKIPSKESSDILHALDYGDLPDEQLYLRTIQGRVSSDDQPSVFYLLLALDESGEQNKLNAELVEKFDLTTKEQKVLLNLIHGRSIKQIAASSFVSENTVKTHLKAIYRKTNTNSQADVIRLVLTDESRILGSYFGSGEAVIGSEVSELDKFATLRDGNVIAYRDYGPADGRPIVVFHNGFGCRVTIPAGHEKILKRTNRRVIIPDRPGFGKSPYIQQHPKGWNDRFTQFIDYLGLTEYDILGNVLGCQMAVHYANSADQRLGKIILSSPVVVNSKKHAKELTGIFAPSVRLVRASKRFAREIYELWLKSVTLKLSTHYRSMLDSSLGSAERELFANNETLDLIVEGFKEGSSKSLDGISHEMVYCLTPAKLDLSKITNPVEIWYGSEDCRISLKGAELIAAEFPNATLHVREGFSEHIYYALFEEIVS